MRYTFLKVRPDTLQHPEVHFTVAPGSASSFPSAGFEGDRFPGEGSACPSPQKITLTPAKSPKEAEPTVLTRARPRSSALICGSQEVSLCHFCHSLLSSIPLLVI